MTLTPEQIEAIRKEWAGVQGEAALKTFAVTHIPALLSALEAAERRAGEAEAKARDQLAEDKHTLADGIRTMRALLGNAEAERDTLRARVERLESHLRVAAIWLDGAIKCKNWVWSPDQREAAEHSLGEIEAALTEKEPTDG